MLLNCGVFVLHFRCGQRGLTWDQRNVFEGDWRWVVLKCFFFRPCQQFREEGTRQIQMSGSVVIAVALVFSDCNTQVHNWIYRLSTILILWLFITLFLSFLLVNFYINWKLASYLICPFLPVSLSFVSVFVLPMSVLFAPIKWSRDSWIRVLPHTIKILLLLKCDPD